MVVYVIVRFLTRPLVGRRGDASAKDLQILVLRHQLRVLRQKTGPPEFHAAQPVGAGGRERSLHRSAWASFPVSRSTLLRWHRELVRKKWTYKRRGRPGRPPSDPEVQALILRIERENPRWGCMMIQGEFPLARVPGRGDHHPNPPARPGPGDHGHPLLHHRDL